MYTEQNCGETGRSEPQMRATPENRRIKTMPVDRLLLDPDNPRLVTIGDERGQFEILQVLYREMAVDELVDSIAANGYFPEEPLFVIPAEPDGDSDEGVKRYTVVEGNRRLAAVLILLNDDWRKKLKATDLPRIDQSRKNDLRELPVSIYDKREQLWAFLSFRHINSPKAWDSFSKARYVAQVHADYGVSLEEIARKIGDRHATVERLFRGYKVLQQAEREAVFTAEDRVRNRFYFSHLYTGLDYPEFKAFLGIDPTSFNEDRPVPSSHVSNLGELMVWLYGKKSEGKEPLVQRQSPDLAKLRDAIGKPESLEELRSGLPLEVAYNTSVGDERLFTHSLVNARQELRQANKTVATGYDGDEDLYRVLADIQEFANLLKREMKRSYDSARRRSRA